MNKIYVTNFINATEPALESFFGHVAPVKSVKLMSNATHMFAFIEYEDVHGAQRAVELFNGKDFQGGQLRVEFARPMHRRRRWHQPRMPMNTPIPMGMETIPMGVPQPIEMGMIPMRRHYMPRRMVPVNRDPVEFSKTDLYVGNLAYSVTEDGLRHIFGATKFVSARIISRYGRSQGYGFITFANEEDQQAAMAQMNGVVVEGRQIKVAVAHVVHQRPDQSAGVEAAATPAAATAAAVPVAKPADAPAETVAPESA